MVKAVIFMLIVQQIVENYHHGLWEVHPITIMVLLLLSSNIYGVIGMIVAIPVYSIGKEIVKFLVALYENHKGTQEQQARRVWNH